MHYSEYQKNGHFVAYPFLAKAINKNEDTLRRNTESARTKAFTSAAIHASKQCVCTMGTSQTIKKLNKPSKKIRLQRRHLKSVDRSQQRSVCFIKSPVNQCLIIFAYYTAAAQGPSMWACLWESCCIALVMSIGDLLAQRHSGVKDLKSIKWMRTFKYASIGLCFIGPVMKCWFNIMHPGFQNQQNCRFADFKQVVNDQLYLPPMLNLGLVFLTNFSKSNSPEEMEKGIRDKYISIMKSHYTFWPGVQILGAFVSVLYTQADFVFFLQQKH
uniref:Mitochondrial inner membrane protein Mpv17 n=1 Tax=Glossina pallidipes TaxID=7398 RepID=A0A1A9ZBK6_GLOPL